MSADDRVERVARWLWERSHDDITIMERTWGWGDILESAREGYRHRAHEVIALIEEDQ